MSIWSTYEGRLSAHGATKHDAAKNREIRFINSHLPDNLSYCSVDILTQDFGFNIDSEFALEHRISQNVAVINSDNLNEKTIISMPGEDIELGSLVFWMDNYWLVTERDANTTLYAKAKMLQCNHILRWISEGTEIIEQWCVVEDGTKYMTGEFEDRNFVVTRPDARISVQIARNRYTVALNRENRFLIDDDDSPHKLSYLLTKPLKSGLTYNGKGTFKFVMQEVTATEYDNHELGIADYYKYFEREQPDIGDDTPAVPDDGRKKVWL